MKAEQLFYFDYSVGDLYGETSHGAFLFWSVGKMPYGFSLCPQVNNFRNNVYHCVVISAGRLRNRDNV